MRTSNPLLDRYEKQFSSGKLALASDVPITKDDIVAKTAITLMIIFIVSVFTSFLSGDGAVPLVPFMVIGMIGGLAAVIASVFKYGAWWLTVLYAIFEGMVLGPFTKLFIMSDVNIKGTPASSLVVLAVVATFAIFGGMLVLYKVGIVRASAKFNSIIFSCIIGSLVVMLFDLGRTLITHQPSLLLNGSWLAIGFTLFVIVIASLSFVTDFSNAESLIEGKAPAYMAWGVALGLAVTLVWLYVEILNLLINIAARSNK